MTERTKAIPIKSFSAIRRPLTEEGYIKLKKQIARREKANATARKKLGAKVMSVEHLDQLRSQKRSVYCLNPWGLLPAAVVMNMSASQVIGQIKCGRIYEYNKEAKS